MSSDSKHAVGAASDSTAVETRTHLEAPTIDQVLQEFYDMLQGSGPSAMVKTVTDEMTKKGETRDLGIRIFLENILDGVVDRIRTTVEQEYVPELRSDLLTLREKEVEERIRLSERKSADHQEAMRPLYEEIELLKEQRGNERGQKEALASKLEKLENELATRGDDGMLVSASHYTKRIDALSNNIEELEKEKRLMSEDIRQKTKEIGVLHESVSKVSAQKEKAFAELEKSNFKLDRTTRTISTIRGLARPSGFFGARDALKRIGDVAR